MNIQPIERVTECRLCDSPNLDLVVAFTPTPPGDHYITADRLNEPQPCYPLDVMCCRACGAVQLADTVDPALIYPEYLYRTAVSKGLTEHFATYATDVLARLKPKPKARVVDIGSNDGTLLRQFQLRGYRVRGVDPASAIVEQATAAGIPTCCDFFGEHVAQGMRLVEGPADIITANHVFANVADVHDFTKGVKELLAPDGTFVFETGYWPAIMRHRLIDTIEHEHIHYFAVQPLARFFARHGLRLVAVEEQTAKGGSLRGFVKHEKGAVVHSSVPRQAGHEHRFGYTNPDVFRPWVAGLEDVRRHMAALIAEKGAQRWIGYGAAVGSTLLLYHLGLGPHLECLVDVNPLKQGLFSPGFHLPVYAPSELIARQPDKVVILAWRYAEMIMKQHHDSAGKCLIPLPEVRVA